MRILASSGAPSRMASKNPPVLMQAVVLYPRGALPAELEGAFERRANEAAEGGEKVISGGLEDPHVEVEIRANQIAGAVLELLHAAVGVGDPVDRGAGVRCRRERRRLRLDHLAKHEQFGDEVFRGRRLQVP